MKLIKCSVCGTLVGGIADTEKDVEILCPFCIDGKR